MTDPLVPVLDDREAAAVIARRIRIAAVIAFWALPLFALADLWATPHWARWILANKLAQLVVVAWTYQAARRATTWLTGSRARISSSRAGGKRMGESGASRGRIEANQGRPRYSSFASGPAGGQSAPDIVHRCGATTAPIRVAATPTCTPTTLTLDASPHPRGTSMP